jgi:7-cyano-7-deazaguanine reductase
MQYTRQHALSGINAKLPKIECWPNQFKSRYEITINIPEFTSVCPRTSLPDFGILTIRYSPDKLCVELKSLKMYILAYRNLGIFYENAVNKVLKDFVKACKPRWAIVEGHFNTRGGISTVVRASYTRKKSRH